MVFFDHSTPERRRRAKIKPVLARSAPPIKHFVEYLTYDELVYGPSLELAFDVECHPNYFLCGFMCVATGKVYTLEANDCGWVLPCDLLGFLLFRHTVIGFNSKNYDLPLLGLALDGVECWKIKERSNQLIAEDKPEFDLRLAKVNHIDLIEVAPLQASLKMYGARLGYKRIQELPYEHDRHLTYEEALIVKDYNVNDLGITRALYLELKPAIEMRKFMSKRYGVDLRSKSDAQMAEAMVKAELGKRGVRVRRPEIEPGTAFPFKPPIGLSFRSDALQRALCTVAEAPLIVAPTGGIVTPPSVEALSIQIGKCTFKMGNGGLHSTEKSLTVFSNDDYVLIDRDVASYYPFILINQNLFPPHIGEVFLEVFSGFVRERVAAKASGDKTTADGLKIGVNGIAGKLSEQFSIMYAPHINSTMTLSGQLFLLMLIERIEDAGISVVSANTDGVVIYCHRSRLDDLAQVIKTWERDTGFVTEETIYRSIHARDVNNYIAVKENSSCKTKGAYCEFGSALNSVLSKNPDSLIISDALQAFLSKGVDLETTIRASKDIRRFVNVRTVKGGGYYRDTYLGKTVRWYYSNQSDDCIRYVLTNNTVPKTEGCRPLMELPEELPADLNYEHYINEAVEALYDLGYLQRARERTLL